MEERMTRLEEMMAQMMAQLAERDNRDARRPRRGYDARDNYEEREERQERYEDRGLKLEIQDFDGTSGDPEVYLEWEKAMERYFEYKDTPDDRKFKLAKMKLIRSAGVWYEGLQKQRIREERSRISTWDKLKTHLRRKYVPANYKQTLYIRLSSLKQEKKNVNEYIREFEKLIIDCDIHETEAMKIGRFVGGLNKDLRDRLEAYPNLGYDEACCLASTFERQRKGSSHTYEAPLNKRDGPRTTWERPPTPYPTKNTQIGSSSNSQPKSRELDKGTSKKDIKDVVCYRCNGFGHMQNDCPNKRAFTMREWRDFRTKFNKRIMLVETDEGDEELFEEDDEGDFTPYNEEPLREEGSEEGEYDEQLPPETHYTMVIRKNFFNAHMDEQHEQRENIFQTKCRVKDEICDVIIDSGSQTNCVDRRLVEKLGIATTPHPRPYRLKWLDDNSGQRVRKQCLVSLKIASYEDDILCDVLNMDACHILLGRPWQHDKKAKHDGYTNIYSFKERGKTKALLPLPPSKCVAPAPEKRATVSLIPGQEFEAGENAYQLDLGGEHGVNASFNIGDLSPYHDDTELRTIPFEEGEDAPNVPVLFSRLVLFKDRISLVNG